MPDPTQFLLNHGLTFVFVALYAEQMGAPVPGLPVLLAAGALSADGKLDPFKVLGVTILACILADTFWFYLGRLRGHQVLGWVCRISLEPDSCVRRTQNIFTRYGLRGLLVAKFVPGLSTVAPPLAGMTGVSLINFLLMDAAGSLIYTASGVGVGYFFSSQIRQIGEAMKNLGGSALGLLIVMTVLYIAYRYWQRQRLLHELRTARITVVELRALLEAGEKPMILDLRSSAELKLDPEIIQGAIHMEVEAVASRISEIPRDRDVVVYCDCPNEITSARIALLLQKQGFTRIRPLLGGIDAWRRQNYPMSTWPADTATRDPDVKIEMVGNQTGNRPGLPN